MATAKRLYLYIVSAIGLGLLLVAGATLIRLLLDRLGLHTTSPYGHIYYGTTHPVREAVAGAIGMIVVGLPLWAIHWGLVERMVRGDSPEAAVERRSVVRSVFFALALGSLLAWAATAAVDFLREGICGSVGAQQIWGFVDIGGSLSVVVAGGGAWGYLAWVRARDLRQGPELQGPAAWISRLYLYGAALVGIGTALAASMQLIGTGIDYLAGYAGTPVLTYPGIPYSPNGPGTTMPTAAWWVRPVVTAAASGLVWTAVWFGHWLYSGRLNSRGDGQGQAERISRVRLAYFVGVVAIGIGALASGVAQSLGAAIGAVVGAPRASDALPLWRDILQPSVAVAVLVLAWWMHRVAAIREQTAIENGSATRASRPMDYVTALIGLGFFATGLATFVALLAQRAMGETLPVIGTSDSWRSDAARAIGLAVIGLPIWLWPWLAGGRRLAQDRLAEARSSSRRYYLFAVTGASVVAGAWGLAMVVSQAARIAVGLESASFGSSVNSPLGFLVVAAPVLGYHLLILRREMAPDVEREGETEVVDEAPAPVAQVAQQLVIVGPAGTDFEALGASIASRLPAGYSIQVRPGGTPPSPDAPLG